ncbi:hypothetical protein [Prolixibacter sp. NT017]|uniref:hypothetical protein n=1 Tax=Prolixibacter sp. NT017 TaxID=2652390 RepID=UPI00128328D4|nr:hypothetical protein [Prolixibacter sp. NT017]GET27003.1 hypothetical protein NT017_33320 [Prolixibacter sp. NT017]
MKKVALLAFLIAAFAGQVSAQWTTGAQTVNVNTSYSYRSGASATSGNTYTWTVTPGTGAADGYTLTNADQYNAQILWKKPGTYTIRITEQVTLTTCSNYKEIVVTVDNNLNIAFAGAVTTCADAETGNTSVSGDVNVSGGTFPWTVVVTDGTTPQTLTIPESASAPGTGTLSYSYDLANNAGGADATKTISITSAVDANGVAPTDVTSTQVLTITQIPATSNIEYQAIP